LFAAGGWETRAWRRLRVGHYGFKLEENHEPMPVSETQPVQNGRWDNRRTLAVVLLGLGIFALAQRFLGPDWNQLVVLAIGVALIVAAFASRTWGMLVAGCVLTGLGSGVVARSLVDFDRAGRAGIFLVCFGAGWFLLWILSAVGFKRRDSWAMIPGGALLLVGLTQLFHPDLKFYLRIAFDLWPYAAIAAGIGLLLLSARKR
jgi:hypothetical protein